MRLGRGLVVAGVVLKVRAFAGLGVWAVSMALSR